MRQSGKIVAAFAAGVVFVLVVSATAQQPAAPRYQIAPWGNSDNILVLDHRTNEVTMLTADLDPKTRMGPWRSAGKFKLDDAVAAPSQNYADLTRPNIMTHWDRR